MPYINLVKITPPAPGDPNVNVVSQINANWDTINAKTLKVSQGSGTADLFANPVTNGVETGMEIVHLAKKYVWNGAAWVTSTDTEASWSGWAQVPLSANAINRPSTPLQYRTNSALRRGELRGGVTRDAVPTAWVHNTAVVISNAVSQPIAAFSPVVTADFIVGSSQPGTPSTQVASGVATINATNGWQLTARYRGNAGALNFIIFDGCHWWY